MNCAKFSPSKQIWDAIEREYLKMVLQTCVCTCIKCVCVCNVLFQCLFDKTLLDSYVIIQQTR